MELTTEVKYRGATQNISSTLQIRLPKPKTKSLKKFLKQRSSQQNRKLYRSAGQHI